jgi:hypothetical protein
MRRILREAAPGPRGTGPPDRRQRGRRRVDSDTRVRDGSGNVGFNTLTGEYEALISAGVADPAIICRSALQNAAASIGSPILTSEAVVAEPPPAGGGAAAVSRAGHNVDFL